jgi:hypothetical protein
MRAFGGFLLIIGAVCAALALAKARRFMSERHGQRKTRHYPRCLEASAGIEPSRPEDPAGWFGSEKRIAVHGRLIIKKIRPFGAISEAVT